MTAPRRYLRNRLMLAFAGFTLFVAALFGVYVAAFAYSVEDSFLNRMVEREGAWLRQNHAVSGSWNTPRDPHMTVAIGYANLPNEIRDIVRNEPQRREFAASHGRHYHLQKLTDDNAQPPVWLVAELSDELVIRPRSAAVLQWLLWSALIVISVALLLGYWLAQRTAAPLARLAGLMDRSLPDRLPDGFAQSFGNDETGQLAAALEQLIDRVRAFVEREREFTRDASHELRTPLTVIRGACEQLLRNDNVAASQRAQITHIQQSAIQLEQAVTTLLALARESDPIEPASDVLVLPIIERVIIDQSSRLDSAANGQQQSRDIEVIVDVDPSVVTRIDEPVLQILLSNLIGNAFAHTDSGEVRIQFADGRLIISNPGTALVGRDFDAHVKGESSDGFGFGLAIVRKLCDRHGIALLVDSEDSARRNRVSIRLDGPATIRR